MTKRKKAGTQPGKPHPKFRAPKNGLQAACWHLIRSLKRDFTVEEIASIVGCGKSTAGNYIKCLRRAGLLEIAEPMRHIQSGALPASYRVVGPMGEEPAVIKGRGGDHYVYIP